MAQHQVKIEAAEAALKDHAQVRGTLDCDGRVWMMMMIHVLWSWVVLYPFVCGLYCTDCTQQGWLCGAVSASRRQHGLRVLTRAMHWQLYDCLLCSVKLCCHCCKGGCTSCSEALHVGTGLVEDRPPQDGDTGLLVMSLYLMCCCRPCRRSMAAGMTCLRRQSRSWQHS